MINIDMTLAQAFTTLGYTPAGRGPGVGKRFVARPNGTLLGAMNEAEGWQYLRANYPDKFTFGANE